MAELLKEFPEVCHQPVGPPQPTHVVKHVIETTGRPVFAKPRRLDPDMLRVAKEEFAQLEAAGIIRRSDSPWSFPLHMVRKKDSGWWPCGDYRCLNNITTPDRYSLPNMQNLNSHMAGCRVFGKLDLVKGYHQVPVAAADVPKTAIITPFSLFEYLYMPFGLKNTSQSFQWLMDCTFADQPCIFVYLDNNLAAPPLRSIYILQVLHQVFQLLKDNSLMLNLQKCEFFQESISFLGHKVHSGGVEPPSAHVDAITCLPPPLTPKELQWFLGMINSYRRFLPAAARTLCPLTEALKGNPKVFCWTTEMQATADAIRVALAAAVPLSHPLPTAELSLATDASDSHIGGVLQQREAGAWGPLGFFFRKLSETECKFSAFHRVLLAAFYSIRHFRIMLEGHHFQLWTDHKLLLAALHRVLQRWTLRQ